MPEISPKYNCEKDMLSKVGPRQASCQVMLVRGSEMAKCHAKVYDRSARANSAVNGLTLTEAGWTDVGKNEDTRIQLGGYPNLIARSQVRQNLRFHQNKPATAPKRNPD